MIKKYSVCLLLTFKVLLKRILVFEKVYIINVQDCSCIFIYIFLYYYPSLCVGLNQPQSQRFCRDSLKALGSRLGFKLH